MEIIRDFQELTKYPSPVVTIGNFDGVHLGHQKIFRRVVEKAREINGTPMAITFEPHPVRALAPEKGLRMLTAFEDKVNLISLMGLKVLICIRFDREFARTEPDMFIKTFLVKKLGTKWVIVGHSYAFGKGKKGTTALLRRRGSKFGLHVSVVRYAKVYEDIVSSSRIRSLLLRGRVCEASRMLGRLYYIEGTVIRGAGRGASLLHTPTANIMSASELIPKEGVYAVKVSFNHYGVLSASHFLPGQVYDGVANIGKNPTFGDAKLNYEVHIFDLDKDLLGMKMRMHFADRLRDEKKFQTIYELEQQIQRDKEKTRQILSRRNDPLYL